jgi:Na+-driven multidrug efflux pump
LSASVRVTVASWIRFVRRDADRAGLVPSDIRQEGVDYLAWTALGVPFVLIGLLLIWLLAGGPAGT